MDFQALVIALLGALVVLGPAYLVFRSQAEKVRIETQAGLQKAVAEARAAERDDDRDDIKEFRDENRKLRRDLDNQAEESRLALAAQSRTYQAKLDVMALRVTRLEEQVRHYEFSEETERALIKANCTVWRTQPCPRLVQLGDPDVAPAQFRVLVPGEKEGG